MIAPTDRRDDRMYVYTVRSSRRSVAAIGRVTDRRDDRSRDRSPRRSPRVNTPLQATQFWRNWDDSNVSIRTEATLRGKASRISADRCWRKCFEF